jgi:ABC-type amino acid transport substrate-binding protein
MKAMILAAGLLALASPTFAQTQEPLKSAIDSTFAPHAMPKLSGGLEGFNIDVVDEMSKRIKRPITVEGAQFAGLLPALQAGTYDFLAAVVTVTPERAQQLLFMEGFVDADYRFMTLASAPPITKLEDLSGQDHRRAERRDLREMGQRQRRQIWLEVGILRHQHRRGAGRARRPCRRQHLGRHCRRLDREE